MMIHPPRKSEEDNSFSIIQDTIDTGLQRVECTTLY